MIKKIFGILLKLFIWSAFSIAAFCIIGLFFGKPILKFLWHDLPFMGKDFDQKTWSAALDCTNLTNVQCAYKYENCDRAPMYRDLERNHLLTGTPKAKVNKMLGEGKTQHNSSTCFEYPLGYCSGLKIDGDYLSVCYDENEKIKSVGHYQS